MSREVETTNGALTVRALTRGEIKAGREFGLGYAGPALTMENFDAACDYCLGCQFDQKTLDGLPNPDLQALFKAVIAETWGAPGEEKNSSRSGSESQTAIDETPAPPA
jgi:hypothetical protein